MQERSSAPLRAPLGCGRQGLSTRSPTETDPDRPRRTQQVACARPRPPELSDGRQSDEQAVALGGTGRGGGGLPRPRDRAHSIEQLAGPRSTRTPPPPGEPGLWLELLREQGVTVERTTDANRALATGSSTTLVVAYPELLRRADVQRLERLTSDVILLGPVLAGTGYLGVLPADGVRHRGSPAAVRLGRRDLGRRRHGRGRCLRGVHVPGGRRRTGRHERVLSRRREPPRSSSGDDRTAPTTPSWDRQSS